MRKEKYGYDQFTLQMPYGNCEGYIYVNAVANFCVFPMDKGILSKLKPKGRTDYEYIAQFFYLGLG